MLKSGTVLELKEPRGDSPKVDAYTGEEVMQKRRDPKSGERVDTDKPVMQKFPYNRIRVVGPSPISHGNSEHNKWTGADAQGVIIEPLTEFGGNLDEPLGKIRALYTVVSVPEDVVPIERTIKVVDSASNQAGETPEEFFARESPGTPPAKGQTRGRTNPLGEVEPDKGTHGKSPL